MARDFTQTPYLTVPATYAGQDEGTFACWARPDFDPAAGGDSYALADMNGNRTYWAFYPDTNKMYTYNDGRDSFHDCTAVDQSVWAHLCYAYKKTGDVQKVYANGSEMTQSSPSGTWGSTAVGTDVFCGSRITGNNPFDGRIAEWAHWNVQLAADEIAALADGYAPSMIRPASLRYYIPMVRGIYDARGSVVTTSGSPGVVDHPRVIYPRRRQAYSVAAAAPGGLSIPVAMHNYRRRRTA